MLFKMCKVFPSSLHHNPWQYPNAIGLSNVIYGDYGTEAEEITCSQGIEAWLM